MGRLLCLVAGLAVCLAFFGGCAGDAGVYYLPGGIACEAANDANVELANRDGPSTRGVIFDDAGAAMLRFSQDLFLDVLSGGEVNAVISPLSAYYVLAMVALGAGGETFYEFRAVLGKCPRVLALDLYALARNLTSTQGSTVLDIVGSVWLSQQFAINADFSRAMTYYFSAPAFARDFSGEGTLYEINRWVYDQTQGLIEDALGEIGPDDVMLLINTLYLSAKWAEAFNPMNETQGYFNLECGEALEVAFLYTRHTPLYVSVADYYEAVLLPYDDDRLGFFLVRPTDGTLVRDFAATHDLMAILGGLEEHDKVRVRMPKLDMEFEFRMNGYLQAMGLCRAFEGIADFSGLTEDAVPVFISDVQQTVRIIVDHEGTEAAAVTIAVAEIWSPFVQYGLIELKFNSPYIYMIYDMQTGAILFMGVVDNPQS